jgi:mono/diheme cytochrome c family protein
LPNRVRTSPAGANRAGVIIGLIVVFSVAAIAVIMFAITGSDWKVPPEAIAKPNPIPITEVSISAGKTIYAARCASCHGDNGNGKGSEAARYATQPADFTDAKIMQAMTDGELFWKITVGNRPMPSFKKRLSEEERWQVINFIRTFSQPQLWSPVPPSAPPSAPR